MSLELINKIKVRLPRLGVVTCSIVVLLLVLSSIKNTLTTGRTSIERAELSISDAIPKLLMKPQPHQDYANFIKHFSEQTEEYQMGSFIMHIPREGQSDQLYDIIPSADYRGLPHTVFSGYKIQNIRTIEARGLSVQDGFRTKPEYTKILNKNIDQYIKDYKIEHEKKKVELSKR